MIENQRIMQGNWLYALACVLLPVAWGLIMVGVVQRIEQYAQRQRQLRGEPESSKDGSATASPDYYI